MTRLATFIGLFAVPAAAAAITWEMRRPDVAAVAEGAAADPVFGVLGASDYRFVSGVFADGCRVHFSYAGDVEALNTFLERLVACRGIEVRLRFSRERGEARVGLGSDAKTAPCQWGVTQNLRERPGVFDVTVYLGDGVIDLEKLDLPPWREGVKARLIAGLPGDAAGRI